MQDVVGHPNNPHAEYLARFREGQARLGSRMLLILTGLLFAWTWGVWGLEENFLHLKKSQDELEKKENTLANLVGDVLYREGEINNFIDNNFYNGRCGRKRDGRIVNISDISLITACSISQLEKVFSKAKLESTKYGPPYCMNSSQASQLSNVCEVHSEADKAVKETDAYAPEMDILGTKFRLPWKLLFPASMFLFAGSGVYLLVFRRKLYLDLKYSLCALRKHNGVDGRIERIAEPPSIWLSSPWRFRMSTPDSESKQEYASSVGLSSMGGLFRTAIVIGVAAVVLTGATKTMWSCLEISQLVGLIEAEARRAEIRTTVDSSQAGALPIARSVRETPDKLGAAVKTARSSPIARSGREDPGNQSWYSYRQLMWYSTFLLWLFGVPIWVAAVLIDGINPRAQLASPDIVEDPPSSRRLIVTALATLAVFAIGTFGRVGSRSAVATSEPSWGGRRYPRFIEAERKIRVRQARHSSLLGLLAGFFRQKPNFKNVSIIQAVDDNSRVLYVGKKFRMNAIGSIGNFSGLTSNELTSNTGPRVTLNAKSAPYLIERSILDRLEGSGMKDDATRKAVEDKITAWKKLIADTGQFKNMEPRLINLERRLHSLRTMAEGRGRKPNEIWSMPLLTSPSNVTPTGTKVESKQLKLRSINLMTGKSTIVSRHQANPRLSVGR